MYYNNDLNENCIYVMSQKFSTEHVVECKCVFGGGVKRKEKHCGDPIQYVWERDRERE